MAHSLSGFFFDVLKWRSSKSAQRMSFAERGVYLEMMCEQWDKRFLPDDAQAVAALIALTDAQVSEVLAAWPAVRAKFVADERRPGRIYNAKLERTRRQQRANYVLRKRAGQIAGKASAAKRLNAKALPLNESLTDVQRSSTEESVKRREIEEKGKKSVRGHRAHAFCGSKFCVPSFLHESFEQQLGERGLARFDVFAWYQQLTARYAEFPIGGDVLAWIRREFTDATKGLFADPKLALLTRSGVR